MVKYSSPLPYLKKISEASSASQLRHIFNRNKWLASNQETFQAFLFRCTQIRDDSNSEWLDAFLSDLRDEKEYPTYEEKFAPPPKKELCIQGSDVFVIEVTNETRNLIETMEKEAYRVAQDICQDNRTRMAKVLGVTVRTVRNRLNYYGVTSTKVAEVSNAKR